MKRLLVIWLILAGCSATEHDNYDIGKGWTDQPMKVKTMTASRKPMHRKILGEGTIEMLDTWDLHIDVPGIIRKIHVSNGAYVKRGDTLLELVNDEEKFALSEAVVRYNGSAYAFESMRMGFENATDTIQQAIRYSSGIATAEIILEQARHRLSKKILVAGITGVLTGFNLGPGQYISPGTILGSIHAPESAMLNMPLLEVDLPLLKNGITASGTAYSGIFIEAIYSGHEPRVDESGIFQTYWKVKKGAGLYPGMHAEMEVNVPVGEAVVLPAEAIVDRGGEPVVFVVKNDTARWRGISTGWILNDMIEISDGVFAGDTVIISNQFEINDGIAVTPF
jgi:RND family efflux transporter MFP subunit